MNILKTSFKICASCGLYENVCICTALSKFSLATRVSLLIHAKEINRLTNTGRIAGLCLENSSVICRGQKDNPISKSDLLPEGYSHRILFPYASEELSEDMKIIDGKPLNLIVPDGTWPQAKKLVISEDYLYSIKRVKLPESSPSVYQLRRTENPGHISTIEAIARALGIVEGNHIRNELEKIFYFMREKLIRLRGY
jgi:DTW domain-containing protein